MEGDFTNFYKFIPSGIAQRNSVDYYGREYPLLSATDTLADYRTKTLADMPWKGKEYILPFNKPTEVAKGSRAELVRHRLPDSTTATD